MRTSEKPALRWMAVSAVCALMLVGVVLTGCSTNKSAGCGHLIIAGGAVQEDSEEVYSAFVSKLPKDAVIGVLPTASGVPEESGASAATTLRMYAGGRDVRLINLTTANPEDASNPDVVKQIEACSGIWFTGGDQKRILSVFRPGVIGASGQVADTPAYEAVRGVLRRGGVIGGTSAGAAMMSEWMILGGRSDDALLGRTRENSEETGFGVGPGMGLLPFGMTDQHFLRRGRLGRLVVALGLSPNQPGFGVEENCAVHVDLENERMTVLGPGAAMALVDTGAMKRDGEDRHGVRVSLLCSGDVVMERGRRVRAAGRAVERARPSESAVVAAEQARATAEEIGAWSAGAVTWAMYELARNPGVPVTLRSTEFDVNFSTDGLTRVFVSGSGESCVTVTDALVDFKRRR